MNGAQLHLLTNHFPVIGTLLITALLACGLYLRNETVIKISLGFFIFIAVISLPAYFSGEEAEEAVEHLAGVSHHNIHEHEEASLFAIIAMEVLGVLAMAALLFKNNFKILVRVTAVVSLIVLALMFRSAWLGGKIMHAETQEKVELEK
ncbi:MAG TPA: hypothetical protein VF691_18390 [Cytophagaceae bacterium]|jgi:glucan phosphoethanolaminetransferase (alkaline phosphatase superfamily)